MLHEYKKSIREIWTRPIVKCWNDIIHTRNKVAKRSNLYTSNYDDPIWSFMLMDIFYDWYFYFTLNEECSCDVHTLISLFRVGIHYIINILFRVDRMSIR